MARHMLSTIDNPYNPFTHFDEWLAYDMRSGYDTSGFLARIANTSPALSPADQAQAIELAIDEIVRENVLGIFIKVSENNDESRIPKENS